MATALDIIKGARWIMGSLRASESPSTDEITRDLAFLNSMIDNWGIREFLSLTLHQESFTLTASQVSYTVGVNQTINIALPNKLSSAFLRDSNTDTDIEVIDRERYDAHGDKTVEGAPSELFYDAGETQEANQKGVIYLYPVPDKAYQLFIIYSKSLTPYASSGATSTFPPSYERVLKYNLAIELAPVYGWDVTVEVAKIAQDSLDAIIRLNSRLPIAVIDLMQPSGFNIKSGDYN